MFIAPPMNRSTERVLVDRQAGGIQEGIESCGIVAEAVQVPFHVAVERQHVERRVIGEPLVLEMVPELFDRIQLGSVRRQEVEFKTGLATQQFTDCRPLVHVAAVPHDDHATRHLSPQLT